ncbi:MAG: endonuclease/exonuclease/phosphatase family protein [Pseudonocardiales bacterium]
MRLASVNLNKRLGNPAARAKLTAWLHHHRVDVLVAQEPWKPVTRTAINLAGYRPVGGDGDLFCWSAERFTIPPVSRPDSFVQRLELGWLVVYNTYLDSGSTTSRRHQLRRLQEIIAAENGRPVLACGDFNLAPRPIDGLCNGRTSTFNNATDRTPFAELLINSGLLDAAAAEPAQFTIERQRPGMHSRFRCDLALVPHYLLPMVNVRYNHSTRASEQAFTDHSGILIDVPVTLDTITVADQDTLFTPQTEHALPPRSGCQPHKTAMSRSRPSPSARTVVDVLVPLLGITSVLDHGCGRGSDVDHYRVAGLDADGWDPHPHFGWSATPKREYDLVTNIFVLNVLPDPWQRIQTLQHATQFTRPGAHLLVVTRSPTDIDPRAASANWPPHQDGYWSSQARGTFQKGISTEEIIALSLRAGLEPAAEQALLTGSSAAGQALLIRPV